jgi:hypothetical protein
MKKRLNNAYLFYTNNWFKINMMIITFMITLFVYKFSLNGRYINAEPWRVLDTRTGKMYTRHDNLIEEYEFIQSK